MEISEGMNIQCSNKRLRQTEIHIIDRDINKYINGGRERYVEIEIEGEWRYRKLLLWKK